MAARFRQGLDTILTDLRKKQPTAVTLAAAGSANTEVPLLKAIVACLCFITGDRIPSSVAECREVMSDPGLAARLHAAQVGKMSATSFHSLTRQLRQLQGLRSDLRTANMIHRVVAFCKTWEEAEQFYRKHARGVVQRAKRVQQGIITARGAPAMGADTEVTGRGLPDSGYNGNDVDGTIDVDGTTDEAGHYNIGGNPNRELRYDETSGYEYYDDYDPTGNDAMPTSRSTSAAGSTQVPREVDPHVYDDDGLVSRPSVVQKPRRPLTARERSRERLGGMQGPKGLGATSARSRSVERGHSNAAAAAATGTRAWARKHDAEARKGSATARARGRSASRGRDNRDAEDVFSSPSVSPVRGTGVSRYPRDRRARDRALPRGVNAWVVNAASDASELEAEAEAMDQAIAHAVASGSLDHPFPAQRARSAEAMLTAQVEDLQAAMRRARAEGASRSKAVVEHLQGELAARDETIDVLQNEIEGLRNELSRLGDEFTSQTDKLHTQLIRADRDLERKDELIEGLRKALKSAVGQDRHGQEGDTSSTGGVASGSVGGIDADGRPKGILRKRGQLLQHDANIDDIDNLNDDGQDSESEFDYIDNNESGAHGSGTARQPEHGGRGTHKSDPSMWSPDHPNSGSSEQLGESGHGYGAGGANRSPSHVSGVGTPTRCPVTKRVTILDPDDSDFDINSRRNTVDDHDAHGSGSNTTITNGASTTQSHLDGPRPTLGQSLAGLASSSSSHASSSVNVLLQRVGRLEAQNAALTASLDGQIGAMAHRDRGTES